MEPSSINEGDAFAEDLDADSLALIELVEALEEGARQAGHGVSDRRRRTSKTCGPCATRSTTSSRSWAEALVASTVADALQERLGHQFADPDLLRQALHRSWCAEHEGENRTSAWSSSAMPSRAGRHRPPLSTFPRAGRGRARQGPGGDRERPPRSPTWVGPGARR
ncbi:MAG: hypothetical protein R2695_01110 [Acidimicrobiales bacterium]